MPSTAQSSHAPLASLAAHWHACKGEIPPPLVGASVTLVDDADPAKAKIYLFGGRLVTTRRMVNDLYELDLLTLRWTKIPADADDGLADDELGAANEAGPSSQRHAEDKPQPRYFHSCNYWQRKLIIFGGMGYVDGNEAELGVLNEIVAFDLDTRAWDLHFGDVAGETLSPEPRYAHLSSITADTLIIIGGQDMANRYVEEINVLDINTRRWTTKQAYDKQRGSYRSLAVEPRWEVGETNVSEPPLAKGQDVRNRSSSGNASSKADEKQRQQHPFLSQNNIQMLPMSSRSYDDDGKMRPLPVYVYTNYNFTDVKREMEVVRLKGGSNAFESSAADARPERNSSDDGDNTIAIEDQSAAMSGLSLPPGLRFPMGAILGVHLLISGTYLANTSQTFAIWALHLPTMTWSRLDVGPLLSSGSWNRGVLWPSQSRLIVFGHRDRDLVADYNHRQTNWDHILLIELEAWGITQPPVKQISLAGVRLGLQKLASCTIGSFSSALESGLGPLEEDSEDPLLCFGGRGDFEIICSDGMRLGCDRAILEKRWPWFANKMQEYHKRIRSPAAVKSVSSSKRGSRPGTGEQLTALVEEDDEVRGGMSPSLLASLGSHMDPRITPRQLHIGEPAPVMLALLIFLYTRCICTQLQRHPAIVSALLIVSKVYEMKDLEEWAKHAAHVIMSRDLAPPSATPAKAAENTGSAMPMLERHRLAVALYESATMSGFEALQIRALRTVMSIAKWVQRSSVSSAKSSATADSQDERPQQVATSALPTSASSEQPISARAQDGFSPTIASAVSPRNESFGRQDERNRRPSKTDRLLAVGGSEATNDYGIPNGTPTNYANSMPLSRSSTQSGQSGSAMPPMQRRPSAPIINSAVGSSATSATSPKPPPPPSASSNNASTSGRKRFSIFGRVSDHAKSSNPSTHLLSPIGVDAKSPADERNVRDSIEHGPVSASTTPTTLSRLHRTNTDGSAGGESSGKSVHSSTPVTALPIDGLPLASAAVKDGGANGGRKMSTTFGRLKASRTAATVQSDDTARGPASGVSGSEDAVQSPTFPSKVGGEQLNQKDMKALQGIFA